LPNGDECRAKAAQCDKKAEQAENAEAKRLLQDAAKEWRTMAALADRHVVWDRRRFSPLKDK
jgi:multidrug resistance efflux pump